ncbi:MAG: ABC transporter permease [Oscillospiraceae bacterium]|nr:ABC transporter permease [Oscillospiraceae bacterium]
MIRQALKMAVKSIGLNKMRSFLTMLGVIIGVIALVVLVSLVSSATDSITDEVSGLGNNLLMVWILDDKANPLRYTELTDLVNYDEIAAVAPVLSMNGTSKYQTKNSRASITGTTRMYEEIETLDFEYGRFIRSTDVENSSYVAVINHAGAVELLGTADVVGESIFVNGRSFRIIGVLGNESSMMGEFMGPTVSLYIPFTTAVRMYSGPSGVTNFYVSATSSESLDDAEEVLTNLMKNRFRQDENAYIVINQSTVLETLNNITGVLTLVLGGIAAISLLVGGIGIMNIMLVSVTERTKEIGIRKAIGAKRSAIMIQFLIEALALSIMGCIIGILISWGMLSLVSFIAGDALRFTLAISARIAAIAVTFSIGIGVIFGLYPANKAAKKNPIEALRYEG